MKNKSIITVLGSFAGTCLMTTVLLANPSMLPDHPGYPAKTSKSPVTDVATTHDPGQENLYEQKALNAATTEYNEEMKIRRAGQFLEINQSEGRNQLGGQEHMTRQN
jgi:hypothetical protein